jgi:hypothetical protein
LCLIKIPKMKRQKKLTNNRGDYNGLGDVTETESIFLPKNEKGIIQLEKKYEDIFDYQLLKNLIVESRKSFDDDIKSNIPKKYIKQINSGIKDYVMSSIKKSYNLDLLKASILNANGYDLITHKYDISEEDVKQIIPTTYFEKTEDFTSIDKSWLIKSNKVLYYQDLKDNSSDIISTFSGIDEPFPFFERQLLNSYTLNFVVAEKFMLNKYNQRRVILTAELDSIIDNIFSSFIVSDLFVDGQYEILCLPNENDLFISEDVNDIIAAEYHIGKSNVKPIKVRREPVKE